MNVDNIQFEEIKLTSGVDQSQSFIRDLNVIKSMSKDNFSKLIDYIFELWIQDEPIDSETVKKWIEDNIGENQAKVKSATNLTFFLLRKAVLKNLTNDEFDRDLNNLKLDIHKQYLVNLFNKNKTKIKEKIEQTKLYFHKRFAGCEWRLDKPLKVSAGKPYEELIATIKFACISKDGDSESLSFESDIDMLKAIVNNLENCLKEAEKWETKK